MRCLRPGGARRDELQLGHHRLRQWCELRARPLSARRHEAAGVAPTAVSFSAAIHACEPGMRWERALSLLDDAWCGASGRAGYELLHRGDAGTRGRRRLRGLWPTAAGSRLAARPHLLCRPSKLLTACRHQDARAATQATILSLGSSLTPPLSPASLWTAPRLPRQWRRVERLRARRPLARGDARPRRHAALRACMHRDELHPSRRRAPSRLCGPCEPRGADPLAHLPRREEGSREPAAVGGRTGARDAGEHQGVRRLSLLSLARGEAARKADPRHRAQAHHIFGLGMLVRWTRLFFSCGSAVVSACGASTPAPAPVPPAPRRRLRSCAAASPSPRRGASTVPRTRRKARAREEATAPAQVRLHPRHLRLASACTRPPPPPEPLSMPAATTTTTTPRANPTPRAYPTQAEHRARRRERARAEDEAADRAAAAVTAAKARARRSRSVWMGLGIGASLGIALLMYIVSDVKGPF